jgi:hypothetical protein
VKRVFKKVKVNWLSVEEMDHILVLSKKNDKYLLLSLSEIATSVNISHGKYTYKISFWSSLTDEGARTKRCSACNKTFEQAEGLYIGKIEAIGKIKNLEKDEVIPIGSPLSFHLAHKTLKLKRFTNYYCSDEACSRVIHLEEDPESLEEYI